MMIEAAHIYQERLKHMAPPDSPWYHYDYPVRLVGHAFVSTYKGEILGKFAVIVNELTCSVVEISALSYSDKRTYIFGKDLMTGLRYLMDNYRKVCFSVIIGNPKEKTYDRLTAALGFTTALRRAEVKDKNGGWKDIKMYEYVNPNWRPANDSE
jgi:hypothetical protein